MMKSDLFELLVTTSVSDFAVVVCSCFFTNQYSKTFSSKADSDVLNRVWKI